MDFVIRVEARLQARFSRPVTLQGSRESRPLAPRSFGLTLEDGKDILRHVQDRLVQLQVEVPPVRRRTLHALRTKEIIKDKDRACCGPYLARLQCVAAAISFVLVEAASPEPNGRCAS